MNLKELKEPFVIFLVGVPLVGKSTFIRENFEGINVISMREKRTKTPTTFLLYGRLLQT
jgi:predicted kinase